MSVTIVTISEMISNHRESMRSLQEGDYGMMQSYQTLTGSYGKKKFIFKIVKKEGDILSVINLKTNKESTIEVHWSESIQKIELSDDFSEKDSREHRLYYEQKKQLDDFRKRAFIIVPPEHKHVVLFFDQDGKINAETFINNQDFFKQDFQKYKEYGAFLDYNVR